jgi:histone acetyltransferase 1
MYRAAAFEDPQDFTKAVEEDGSKGAFTPPGKLFSTYKRGSKQFEVWSGSLSDPAVKAILKNLQFFVPLFIEAGSYIELDDPEWTLDRWQVFFL